MDKAELVTKLSQYKSLLAKHFDLDCLILYGSYAKGTQRDQSHFHGDDCDREPYYQ